MFRPPPSSPLPDTLFPYPTLFRSHHGRDEMALPMPLEDRVVELDLRDPSIQGLVHPDPDRRLAALPYVEGIAGRGLAWPPNGNFQGTRLRSEEHTSELRH